MGVFVCLVFDIMRNVFFVLCLFNAICLFAESDYKLGGRLFLDGGTFLKSPSEFNSGVSIPDLRLTGKAYFSGGWYTKLDVGFSGNKVRLKDAFIQKNKNNHMLRLGYMIGMFSLDQSSSTNDYLFMTGANVAETFYPDRRIGGSYTYSDTGFYFSGGLFCGDGLNFEKNIKQGFNTTIRFVYRPVNDGNMLLHLGIGGLYKRPDKNIETGDRNIRLASKGNCYLPVPYVFDTDIKKSKEQYQWNFEGLLHYRRMFVQGEVMGMFVRRYDLPCFKAIGTYLEGGYFLIGENLGYDQRDALPVCSETPGSLAIFARINYTDLNSRSFKCGTMFDVSLGMNYYLNKNIIVRLNYSNVRTDKYSAIAKSTYNIIQSRVQIRF